MEYRLNWLIFGAGAIGTYVGVSLILHGQKVVFIDQSPVASEILEHGLGLNIRGQEHRILHPTIFTDVQQALRKGPFDVVIFAIKSYDTQAALDTVHPFVHQLPTVLCLQNGVENEPLIETIIGADKVLAGTVTSSVSSRGVGNVKLERLRGIGIAAGNPLSTQIVQVFSDSGLYARLYPSSLAMKWSKMLTNLLANASTAILDLTPAQIFTDPSVYAVEIAQLREAIAVMRAYDIKVVDLPGTSVRSFAWGVSHLPLWLSRILLARFASQGRGQKMPSLHIDLHSGKGKSEVEYLNGAVVRYGARMHIPTPVNHWLNQTLSNLAQGISPLELYAHQPERYTLAINQFVESERAKVQSIVS